MLEEFDLDIELGAASGDDSGSAWACSTQSAGSGSAWACSTAAGDSGSAWACSTSSAA
ncbi:MAG TPA: hypothetical protein VFO60_08960 [Candidatus Dormibacteraeota bacterium]|nr:hypothetical protein [Candidatus Dormibacteraeota bacterium]